MSEESPPSETVNSIGVSYISLVRLRHHSGQLLASTAHNYTHAGGSNQQIVGCVEEADEATLWLLRPRDKCDYEKTGSDKVEEGDVIRLQHLKTGLNLHSHDRVSPDSGQQEVSCLGEDGLGNFDDDWVVESREGNGVGTNKVLRLLHVRTGYYLHSHHDRALEIDGRRFQETTCYEDDDSNNDWQIVEVLPAPSKFTLHPFISLSSGGAQKSFEQIANLEKWVEAEAVSFSWAMKSAAPLAHDELRSHLTVRFDELRSSIQQCNSATEPRSFQTACEQTLMAFKDCYEQRALIFSDSSTFQFVKSLEKEDPAAASHALAYFLNLEPEPTSHGFKGLFSALCHENALAGRAKSEADTLVALQDSFRVALEGEKSTQERLTKALESHLSVAQNRLDERERAFKTLTKKSEDELKAVTATYDNYMATHASVSYWSTKAEKHEKAYKKLAGMALLSGSIVVFALILLVLDVFGFSSQADGEAPQWWRVGSGIVVATFGIWGVRVMVQLLYSNVHLMSDAEERATMIQAYQAMMREQVLPLKEEHKLLILQSLFRPTSSGVVKDDGSPTTWLDFIANKLGDK